MLSKTPKISTTTLRISREPLDRLSHTPAFASCDSTGKVAETALQCLLISIYDELVAVVGIVDYASIVYEVEPHDVLAEAVEGEEWINDVAG